MPQHEQIQTFAPSLRVGHLNIFARWAYERALHMASLEDFENTLKEVVNAKRLSASKMSKLTEIAMKSLETDTKLVAILYRTHKSLPSSAKVSSLYAFDALARAARSIVNKHGITGDINSARGNAATFLLKIEGVLDGLFQDMGSLDNLEIKEKTKKVLDIWVKSNTFPSTVLTRLRDILSDVYKAIPAGVLASNEMRITTETPFRLLFPSENAVNPTITADPRSTTEAPAIVATSQLSPQTPATPASGVQATLLALLGQAAQAQVNGEPPSQTPPNTDPQLQDVQLALLQHLALTAKLANDSLTPPPGQTTPPTGVNPSPATILPSEPLHPTSRPPQAGGPRFDTPGDTRYGRSDYPDRVRDPRDPRGERIPRGGTRGGYRGRGRWDDHHNHDRFRPRDRDWEPPPRPRLSRSRSPRRYEERRNVRTYSPARRPSSDQEAHHQSELPTAPFSTTPGKDEFGRDIRASSETPSRSTSVENTQALTPMDSSVDPNPGAPPDNRIPVSDQLPLVAASTSVQSTETHTTATQQQPGLDQFDISMFDATAPSSWEALGNMWKATCGYLPSQEELMHFMMTGSTAGAGMANNGGFNGAQQGGQWQQGNWDEQGPRSNGGRRGGGGRGRGNYNTAGGGHGNYRDGSGYAGAGHIMEESSEPSSYAVVLNGDAEPGNSPATDNQSIGHMDERNEDGRGGGRMQRVGDKWMFVREGES